MSFHLKKNVIVFLIKGGINFKKFTSISQLLKVFLNFMCHQVCSVYEGICPCEETH